MGGQILLTGSVYWTQNIKVEYNLNKETNKVNEECDLGVGFDDTTKADKLLNWGQMENLDGWLGVLFQVRQMF